MSIDQIYCTRSGEGASHPESGQGQSAEPGPHPRASSLEGEALRRCCEAIRPCVDYCLPPDTEPQQRRELTAATAPRRLFFLPRVDGFQAVGQTCYRPAEAGGGADGGFAHVLLHRPTELPERTAPPAETQPRGVGQDDLGEGGEESDAASPDSGQSDLEQFREEAPSDQRRGEPPGAAGEAGPPPVRGDSDWSILDALRLWGAPGWVDRDSSAIAPRLPPLESLADLLAGQPPAIDAPVFLSFLKDSGSDSPFHDPAAVISERWRAMDPAVRRRWFAHLFCRFLHAETAERQPVLLVAEPSLAALLFYGIGRLLPAGPLRDGISFSTFETDPERIAGALGATWFSNPQASGTLEEGAWPGRLVNTLAELPAEDRPPKGQYVGCMIELLCEQGWKAVDEELSALASQEVSQCGELESFLAVRRAVTALLETGGFPNEGWRSSAAAIRYLRQELARRVAAIEDPTQGLQAVVGGPSHLAVIDLLTAKPTLPGTRKAVIHLLTQLPPQKILGLLKLSGVPDDDKVTVLGRYIHGNGDLPLGCEFLWEDFSAAGEGPRRPGAVLMGRVLARLPTKNLKKLYRNVTRECAVGFVMNVLRLCKHNRLKVESLTAVVQAMDEVAVVEWLQTSGPETLRSYPKNEPALGEKLAELLHTLPRHPLEFKQRLDLILAGQHLLPDQQHREAAAAWETCYHLIRKASSLQKPESGTNPQMRVPLLVNACRDLAKAADQAMSLEVVEQHMTWNQKRDALLRIAQEVLGGIPLLLKGPWEHDAILERIGTQFHHHRWPTEPLKREAPAKKEPARKLAGPESRSMASTGRGLMIGTVAGIAVLSALVVWFVYWMFFGGMGEDKTREKTRRERKRERQPVSIPRDDSGLVRAGSPSGRDPASAASPRPAVDVTAGLLRRLPGWLSRQREAAWEPPDSPPDGRESFV